MAIAKSVQRDSIGASSPGSLSSSSRRANSSGSSRTSTGSASSNNDSTCSPTNCNNRHPPASGQHAGKSSFWRRTEPDTGAEITA